MAAMVMDTVMAMVTDMAMVMATEREAVEKPDHGTFRDILF